MKRNCIVWLVGLVCMFPMLVSAGNASPWEKELPFKNITIKYAIHGMEEGEEIIYIRDHGKERARYHTTTTKMMGMTMNNSTIEFMTPDFIYTYDLQEKSGSKAVNPQKYMIEEYEKLSSADKKKVLENAEKKGGAFIAGMGGSIEQNAAEILSYSCDKLDIMGGSTTYLIHDTDIPLKTDVAMMGMKMTMEATSVDNGKVSGKYFKHPAGIVAEVDPQTDEISRNMARQTIAMLKDPEGARQEQPAQMGGQQQGKMSEEDQQMMKQMMEGMKGMFGQ